MADIVRRNFRQYDKDDGQAGMFAPSGNGWNFTTSALTAGRAYLVRFVPSRPMTIASVEFIVTTLGADVACDVGIYDAAYNRVAASTAAASRLNTTGIKNISLASAYTVAPSTVYYAAFSSDTGSTATLTFATANNSFVPQAFGTTAGKVLFDYQASSHPLPSTLTGNAGAVGAVPMLVLREA